jgi:acyl-CoA reductase-like NAD-dependent aldehyde dehydrogenase
VRQQARPGVASALTTTHSCAQPLQVAAELLPKGVLNVITGRGATVGQPLAEHPKVAMVSLTGDVSSGRKTKPMQRSGP